jgi:hypothetical protein
MAGTTVWTAGQVLSAASLNGNFDKLPYAYAAGTGATTTGALGTADGTTVTINITYPASRFTVAPIVQAWTTNNRYTVSIGTNTAGSAVATVRNVSAASGTDATLYWTAVQMTSGTAAG